MSPGLGPDGLPSPGGYPRRGPVSSGNGSCSGSPPPYPGSTSINFQNQRRPRERGNGGVNNVISTTTTERVGLQNGAASQNSPFSNELLAAAMRSGAELPNLSASLLSPRLRASVHEEPDIKRELDSPTPKRSRISVSSQDLLDQLSVVHEGARRLVTNNGSLARLDHSSASSLNGISHPPQTGSPVTRRGPLRAVNLNSGSTNQRWISGGIDRSIRNNTEQPGFGGTQHNMSERGNQRLVYTRRSPHNFHHHNYHSSRDYYSVRRSPHQYHPNQHNMPNRRNTRQRERERNRAAALAAARAVAANLQSSFSDILRDEVSYIRYYGDVLAQMQDRNSSSQLLE